MFENIAETTKPQAYIILYKHSKGAKITKFNFGFEEDPNAT